MGTTEPTGRVRITRPGKNDEIYRRLGTLPKSVNLTTSDVAESWLRSRLLLLLPGPHGLVLGEGIIAVALPDARPSEEAITALLLDGVVDVQLVPGALRISIRFERLQALLTWARRAEAEKGARRREVIARRPESDEDQSATATALHQWLLPPPEKSEQKMLFGGGR